MDPQNAVTDPATLSTPELVAFVVSRHQAFLRDAFPFLVPLAAKVARVHGDHDPRLRDLEGAFTDLREALLLHLEEEEESFFRAAASEAPDADRLARELAAIGKEHAGIEADLRRMRALCDGYVPPAWACTSYRRLLDELRRLEEEVLRHMHLETEVLVPRFAEVR